MVIRRKNILHINSNQYLKVIIFVRIKYIKKHLAAGLRPNPLGELEIEARRER